MSVKNPAPAWLEPHLSVCEAIATLLAPYAEVVVHDLRRGRVVGLWSPISKRKVGDPSLDSEMPQYSEDGRVVGPYGRVLPDGRHVTSVGVVLHNAKGAPRGLLCINLDRSPLDGMIDVLVRFAAPREDRPAGSAEKDWREQIRLVVDQECRSRHLRRERLTRDQRLELIRVLNDRGLFATRNAAAHAAGALGVSRTTVYALLKEAHS
jgi:predicted transcriptional regulator YheO